MCYYLLIRYLDIALCVAELARKLHLVLKLRSFTLRVQLNNFEQCYVDRNVDVYDKKKKYLMSKKIEL